MRNDFYRGFFWGSVLSSASFNLSGWFGAIVLMAILAGCLYLSGLLVLFVDKYPFIFLAAAIICITLIQTTGAILLLPIYIVSSCFYTAYLLRKEGYADVTHVYLLPAVTSIVVYYLASYFKNFIIKLMPYKFNKDYYSKYISGRRM